MMLDWAEFLRKGRSVILDEECGIGRPYSLTRSGRPRRLLHHVIPDRRPAPMQQPGERLLDYMGGAIDSGIAEIWRDMKSAGRKLRGKTWVVIGMCRLGSSVSGS